jgi:hypothetical protein
MPVAGGGFEQCYNAQAVVTAGSLPVLATDVVQAPNDKQQLTPMPGKLAGLPEALGRPDTLLADSGYFSAANVTGCQAAGLGPLIAPGREEHYPTLAERFAAPPPHHPTPVEAMAHLVCAPRRAGPSTPCASTRRSRCSASSRRCWEGGAGVPAVSATRARRGPRRMAPRGPGVEPAADVRPNPRRVGPDQGSAFRQEMRPASWRSPRATKGESHCQNANPVTFGGTPRGPLHYRRPEARVRQAASPRSARVGTPGA